MPALNKKNIIIILLFIVLALAMMFWLVNRPKPAVVENLGTIVGGWNNWIGAMPYLVAHDKGFFAEQGLELELKAENSYSDKIDSLINKKIDFSCSIALIDAIKLISDGRNFSVVGVVDDSNGADGIVAGNHIKSVTELKGKKVAVETGTLGEYLLYAALKKYGIDYEAVEKLNYTAKEAVVALQEGKVDAAVTYEPDLSLLNQNGFTKIFTSADKRNLITDVLIFDRDFIKENPKKVKAVLAAYFKAVDFIKNNPDEANAIGAKYFKITPPELAEQLKGIRQIDRRGNSVYFSYAAGVESLYAISKEINDFMTGNGLIDRQINVNEFIDGQFVKELN